MPVSKKPRRGQPATLDNFLSTPSPGRQSAVAAPDDKIYRQQVRIEQRYINQIDELCKQRRTKTPRHAWLLEAIFEKMDREL